jgi:hypothetical protein
MQMKPKGIPQHIHFNGWKQLAKLVLKQCEKLEPSSTAGDRANWHSYFGKLSGSTIPSINLYMYSHTHSSTGYNDQDWELPGNTMMDKYFVVHSRDGMPYSNENNWFVVTHHRAETSGILSAAGPSIRSQQRAHCGWPMTGRSKGASGKCSCSVSWSGWWLYIFLLCKNIQLYLCDICCFLYAYILTELIKKAVSLTPWSI